MEGTIIVFTLYISRVLPLSNNIKNVIINIVKETVSTVCLVWLGLR